MVECEDRFQEQLKHEQHLYLFSHTSIRELFRRLGAEQIAFEPAMFAHYDMFLAVSRVDLTAQPPESIAQALTATPRGRMVLALLDLDDAKRESDQRLAEAEADRIERLAVIERQGAELGRVAALEADVEYLKGRLAASEADRAERLAVIERQGGEIGQAQARMIDLQARIAESIGLLQPACLAPRFGVAMPSEVKRMREAVGRTIARLSGALRDGGEAVARDERKAVAVEKYLPGNDA
jgi:hypothetical protein